MKVKLHVIKYILRHVPAGKLNTPTPTIPLTRLKTSFGIDAPSVLVATAFFFAPPLGMDRTLKSALLLLS